MANNKENIVIKKEFLLHFEENRLATFKDWPFDENSTCTPAKLAQAGFYHCPTDNEPDLVKCFVCLKELDGWEPEDDPWDEHVSHASYCPLLKKKPEDLTVMDMLKLEAARAIRIIEKTVEKRVEEYETYSEEAKAEITKLMR